LAGLILGKPVGILLATWLGTTRGLSLPTGMTLRTVAAIGLVGGAGFTVSLFVSELAFNDEATVSAAKLAVLIASMVASAAGAGALLALSRTDPR
jgi:NhaA family Na+:H+ antiporter